MPAPDVQVYPDARALSAAAADFVARCAAAAIVARGRFTIALSGGSTPRALYLALAAPPWRAGIDWRRWHVFWGDERLVPADDPRSNTRLARETLLSQVPILPDQVHPVPLDAGAPEAIARAYEEQIRRCFGLASGLPRFDLVLLGLGSDGHTASLFPGQAALEERERLVVATPPGELPPAVERASLTLPVLNAARTVAFLVAGVDKAPALQRVLAGDWSLPASRVQPFDGELHWFVDRAALGQG